LFHVSLELRSVDLNYNFECDWLIELSDNKLVSELEVFELITIEEIVFFLIKRVIMA